MALPKAQLQSPAAPGGAKAWSPPSRSVQGRPPPGTLPAARAGPAAERPGATPAQRFGLSGREEAVCKNLVDTSGGLLSPEAVRGALAAVGQLLLPGELHELLEEVKYTDGTAISVEQFLGVMRKLKKEFVQELDAEQDTIRAFVAVGGAPDKTGTASIERLREIVTELGLDASAFEDRREVRRAGSSPTEAAPVALSYQHFADIFSSRALERDACEQEAARHTRVSGQLAAVRQSVQEKGRGKAGGGAAQALARTRMVMRLGGMNKREADKKKTMEDRAEELRVLLKRKRQLQARRSATPGAAPAFSPIGVERCAREAPGLSSPIGRTPLLSAEGAAGSAYPISPTASTVHGQAVDPEPARTVTPAPRPLQQAAIQQLAENRERRQRKDRQEQLARTWMAMGREELMRTLGRFVGSVTAGDVVRARQGAQSPSADRQLGTQPPSVSELPAGCAPPSPAISTASAPAPATPRRQGPPPSCAARPPWPRWPPPSTGGPWSRGQRSCGGRGCGHSCRTMRYRGSIRTTPRRSSASPSAWSGCAPPACSAPAPSSRSGGRRNGGGGWTAARCPRGAPRSAQRAGRPPHTHTRRALRSPRCRGTRRRCWTPARGAGRSPRPPCPPTQGRWGPRRAADGSRAARRTSPRSPSPWPRSALPPPWSVLRKRGRRSPSRRSPRRRTSSRCCGSCEPRSAWSPADCGIDRAQLRPAVLDSP
eukprot:TRINITY_DN12998_c0_g1_i1.p1 TRINITY_DN12998_c0_g1~~TRINITY_DN12998_c0_g1_i1.p1  ORF type:complete len:738 (+),score=101.23 TRINITY_DN12998_c0_g1_i1:79-2214(+)